LLQKDILELKNQLAQDGFAIVEPESAPGFFGGHKSSANVAFELHNDASFAKPNKKTMRRFTEFLWETKESCRNVIVSSEEFSNHSISVKGLHWMFQPWDHVTIVVVYRRYFEWLYSFHNQINKGRSRAAQPFPSFVETLRKNRSLLRHHPSQAQAVIARFSKYYEDIRIINYHDQTIPLTSNFFCNLNLTATCHNVQGNVTQTKNINKSLSLEYFRLAQLAKDHGILKQKYGIAHAAKQIKTFAVSNYSLPMDCLEDNLADELYQTSVAQEEAILPQWKEGRATIWDSFQFFKGSEKLCAIDVIKALNDTRWIGFLKSL
jgi:hypothetical protein